MAGLPRCRKPDIVIRGHEVIVGVTTRGNPCCLSIRERSREQTGVDSLTVDSLLFDAPHFLDIGSIHELLKRLMSEDHVSLVVRVRVVHLLPHEPTDGVRSDTISAWEAEVIRATPVL